MERIPICVIHDVQCCNVVRKDDVDFFINADLDIFVDLIITL